MLIVSDSSDVARASGPASLPNHQHGAARANGCASRRALPALDHRVDRATRRAQQNHCESMSSVGVGSGRHVGGENEIVELRSRFDTGWLGDGEHRRY
jgi:hypothetical protein